MATVSVTGVTFRQEVGVASYLHTFFSFSLCCGVDLPQCLGVWGSTVSCYKWSEVQPRLIMNLVHFGC